MNSFAKGFTRILTTAALGLTFSTAALSQATNTNGYVCDSKNPGGEDTRLYYREQNGIAENISGNASFPVVCPLALDSLEADYDILIRLGNGDNMTQTFQCALEEYDLGNNKVRSIGKSMTRPPFIVDAIVWLDYRLRDTDNTLSIRCILPPKGQVGLISWSE